MTDALRVSQGLFQLPEDGHYLNCAYMSPLAEPVERAVIEGLRLKRDPTRVTPEHFFAPAHGVRERFARLIGAPAQPERVALLPAVSYGIAVAARNLPVSAGQSIVLLDEQFPGNVYAWTRLAEERGASVVRVARPGAGDAHTWSQALLEAIGPRTAVVAVPAVHWTDGTRFDLVEVGRRCRDVGAALVVDGTQSIGAVPFDVEAVRPDAVVSATYKWLMGPYGMALGWFGPRFDDGIPLEEGWITRAGSEDFGGLVDYVDAYQPGALRYDVGERSNFALVPGVAAGLDLILEWRPERISEVIRDLTAPALDAVRSVGFRVEADEARSPHMFGIGMPEGLDPGRVAAELGRHRVHVSRRGRALRVSPHLYNDANDLSALVDALTAALPGR